MEKPGNVELKRRLPNVLIAAAVLFLAAGAAAAIYDWFNWEPYNAVLPYFVVVVLVLAAVVLATRRRGRPVALLAAAIALGVVAGHMLGPSRPVLEIRRGTLEVTLLDPANMTATGTASCESDDRATELQLTGATRLDVIPNSRADPAIAQQEFVTVGVWVGDRWDRVVRSDGIALWVSIGRVEADLPGTTLVAGPASTVTIDWTAEGGRLDFAGLVPEAVPGEQPGQPVDLAGSFAWTCRSEASP